MNQLFISALTIEKVRHLEDIRIPLSKDRMKHLIFTGRNGSGKTSVLDAMAGFLNAVSTTNDPVEAQDYLNQDIDNLEYQIKNGKSGNEIADIRKRIEHFKLRIERAKQGIDMQLNYPLNEIRSMYEAGGYIIAYYKADRIFRTEIPRHVEKVELKEYYSISDTPRQDFVKYLLDLKMTQALAATGGKTEKADVIKTWFNKFEDLLGRIFEDGSLKLNFDEDTFQFTICETGKEPFDFNSLSSGYAAVLDIIVDIIIRMEKRTGRSFKFEMPGIVLIDEIETHLHLELQKRILDLLTTIVPNIQFIVSTHSPFILNSLENVVIYDLENHLLVEDGLTDVPYDGIVEGYFNVDKMSAMLREKYERYKMLVRKKNLSDEDIAEIAKLEMFLDEIPDYLALNISTEYKGLKLDFESREDLL